MEGAGLARQQVRAVGLEALHLVVADVRRASQGWATAWAALVRRRCDGLLGRTAGADGRGVHAAAVPLALAEHVPAELAALRIIGGLRGLHLDDEVEEDGELVRVDVLVVLGVDRVKEVAKVAEALVIGQDFFALHRSPRCEHGGGEVVPVELAICIRVSLAHHEMRKVRGLGRTLQEGRHRVLRRGKRER